MYNYYYLIVDYNAINSHDFISGIYIYKVSALRNLSYTGLLVIE